MKFRKKIRQVPEAFLFILALGVLPLLPRRAILFLSHAFGRLAYCLCGNLRRIALANLDIALGETRSQDEKTRIAKESFRIFSLVMLDVFWFGRFTEKRLRRFVLFDASFDHLFGTKPAVVVAGHLGNWEMLGLATALHGHPLASVAAEMQNPVVDSTLNRLRRSTGQKIINQHGALRNLLRVLRDGGRAALMLDQNTVPTKGGEFVEFFGLPATMSRLAAALADRTDASIVVVYCLADENGTYTAYALPPLTIEKERTRKDSVTQEIAKRLQVAIEKAPGQWLWMYKRWHYIPQGGAREKFPFYARYLREDRRPGRNSRDLRERTDG